MLDAGADDDVTKPFGADELLARIRAVVCRTRDNSPRLSSLDMGDCELTLGRAACTSPALSSDSRLRNSNLVLYLARHPHRVVGRRELLEAVWGEGSGEHAEYLRLFIGQLRKLEPDPSAPRYIATEPWVGYRFTASANATS